MFLCLQVKYTECSLAMCYRSGQLSPKILHPGEVGDLITRTPSFRGGKHHQQTVTIERATPPPIPGPLSGGSKLSPPVSPTGALAPPRSPKSQKVFILCLFCVYFAVITWLKRCHLLRSIYQSIYLNCALKSYLRIGK